MRLGDLERALTLQEHVLAVHKRLLPADHPDLLSIQLGLASTLMQLGDLERALALQEHVLAAHERLLPADHPDLLTAKHNMAATRMQLLDLESALALQEHVLAARERLFPADHPDLLGAKHNLAATRKELGDLHGALALEEQVLDARERHLPPHHPDLLVTKLNLAATRDLLGDLEGALVLNEHVHTALERRLPADHPNLLAAKHNLASTRRQLGDLLGALVLEEQVLAAQEQGLRADDPRLLETLLSLATTRNGLGDLEGAHALFEDIHAAWERTLPPHHPNRLTAALNLATTREMLGDRPGAHELLEAVHTAREVLLPADHPQLLIAKQNLAVIRNRLGDLEGALVLEEKVLAAREGLWPADHPEVIKARLNLAVTRARLGDGGGALALARDIADALPDALEPALTAAPREARTTVQSTLHFLARARTWSRSEADGLEEASFEVLETARYAVGAPLLARLGSLTGEEASSIRRTLDQSGVELERLVANGPELPELDDAEREARCEESHRKWRAATQATALRREQAQKDLLALLGEEVLERVTVEEVAGSLAPGHVAIGITQLPRWRWDEETLSASLDGPHYLAHVVLPGGRLHEVDLGPTEILDRHVDAWRAALGAPVARGGVGVAATDVPSELEAGRALRRLWIDPLLAAAGVTEAGATLHLCLDGALFTVPVDALPLEEGAAVPDPIRGDAPRLGDLHRVRYELSMARLVQPGEDPDAPASVLAVGGIDFDVELAETLPDTRPLARLSSWGEWERLSGTDAEVSELAHQARHHLAVEAELLRRDEVTEAALAEAVRGVRYVHLATHGWFLPEHVKSMLDDEPRGGSRDLLGSRETVTGFAPLTLCGLVLSGANSAGSSAELSARLLTAQELAAFDLSACELAVLSACETNVGIARAGQGIQSLQTALHRAGARTSLTSLWAVRDWPTQSLMKRFYDNLWGERMGKAEALWAAKQALRREGDPALVWAGWVLAGDPD